MEDVWRKRVLSVEDGAGWEDSSQQVAPFPDLGLPLVRSVTQQSLSAAMSQARPSGLRCNTEKHKSPQLRHSRESDNEHRNSCQTVLPTVL